MALIESNPNLLAALRGSPGWIQIRDLVLNAVSSAHSKRAYGQALDEFLAWFQGEQPIGGLCKATVQRYRVLLESRGLASSSINVNLAAIRKLAAEAADNGLFDAETARAIRSIKGVKEHGTRIGNWLSHEQAQGLLNTPDRGTRKGLRDVA